MTNEELTVLISKVAWCEGYSSFVMAQLDALDGVVRPTPKVLANLNYVKKALIEELRRQNCQTSDS